MKKVLLLLVIITTFALTSCDLNDGNSLDNAWVGMGTVQKVAPESRDFYIVLDNGDKLWPAATNIPGYNPKDGQRLIANYTILSDGNSRYNHDVKLNSIYEVLTKPIVKLTTANADSIGNDRLTITDMWIGADHLNIEFEYLGYSKRHMVNLVESDLSPSTPEMAKLQFRQNGYGDEPMYLQRGIVSFSIKSLKVEGKTSRKIELTTTNLHGDVKTVELTYSWGQQTLFDTQRNKEVKDYSEVK